MQPGADDLVAAHQHRAIVQRRIRAEDGGQQVGGHGGPHRRAGLEIFVQPHLALDGDDGAGGAPAQPLHRLGDLLGHAGSRARRRTDERPGVCPSRASACRSSGWNTTSAANTP